MLLKDLLTYLLAVLCFRPHWIQMTTEPVGCYGYWQVVSCANCLLFNQIALVPACQHRDHSPLRSVSHYKNTCQERNHFSWWKPRVRYRGYVHTHTLLSLSQLFFYNANTTPLLDWVWLSSSVAEWMTENQSPLYASVSVCLFVFFL